MSDLAPMVNLSQFVEETELDSKMVNNPVHYAAFQSTMAFYKLAAEMEKTFYPEGRPKGNKGRKKRDPSQSCNVYIEFYTPQQHKIRKRVIEKKEKHEYNNPDGPISSDGKSFVKLIAKKYKENKPAICAEYIESDVFKKKPASVKNAFILSMKKEFKGESPFKDMELFDEEDTEEDHEEDHEEDLEEDLEEEEEAIEDVAKEEQQQPAVRAKKGKRKSPAASGQREAQSPKAARLSRTTRKTGLIPSKKSTTPQKKAPPKPDEDEDDDEDDLEGLPDLHEDEFVPS